MMIFIWNNIMKKKNFYFGFAIILITLIYIILSENIENEMILPKINLIGDYFQNLEVKVFITHTTATISKVIISYAIALLIALFLSILANYRNIHLMINPYISIIKTVPTISIILIAFMWLGNEKSIYLIPFLVVVPILYETFYYHIRNIDPRLIEVCQVYQFNYIKKVRFLYFYPLLEALMLSLKQTFGYCFKVVVMAEVIGEAHSGIGSIIQNEKRNLEMPGVFSWTIILIILVLLIDLVLNYSTKKVIRWKCYDEN